MKTAVQKPEAAMETVSHKPETTAIPHTAPPPQKSPIEGGQGVSCSKSHTRTFKKIASEIKSVTMSVFQKSATGAVDMWQAILFDIENNTDFDSTESYCRCKEVVHRENCLDISARDSINAFDLQPFSEYSDKLGINFDGTENMQLIMAVDEWLGTTYRWGGCSKYGIDCSCFVKSVYKDVYDIELSRSSYQIFYNDLMPVNKEELQEGDLLFFKIKKNRISHVGIYLKNNKFAHASQYRGVVIDDLNKRYYRKRFFSGGRPEGKLSANASERPFPNLYSSLSSQ
ncbi:MAG: hypothetical protein GY795_48795 [Desulfobacterales bacterium]|nr:hypothetical protein [Desulfobacterales bacterium]